MAPNILCTIHKLLHVISRVPQPVGEQGSQSHFGQLAALHFLAGSFPQSGKRAAA
jgi:hypothetical protein